MNLQDWQTIVVGVSSFIGALGGVASIGFWLATRFNRIYERINATEKLLMLKMDDHEKLDIERFSNLQLALMKVEMTRPTGLAGVLAPP